MIDRARRARWAIFVASIYKFRCPHCGSKLGSVHHIISKSCKRTEFLAKNGIFCCDILHRIFEGQEGYEKQQLAIDKYIGRDCYNQLELLKTGALKITDVSSLRIVE